MDKNVEIQEYNRDDRGAIITNYRMLDVVRFVWLVSALCSIKKRNKNKIMCNVIRVC